MPGLRVFRSLRPPFVNGIGIGPSWTKIPLDFFVACTSCTARAVGALRRGALARGRELVGRPDAAMLGVPHLYDMHSSLPQQLDQLRVQPIPPARRTFAWLERFVVRRSQVVVVICPHLADVVRGIEPGVPTVLIENAPGSGDTPVAGSGARVRHGARCSATAPIVLYTGTFEAYQGLDLLFAAARTCSARRPDVRFVLAGGRPDQIDAARAAGRAAPAWPTR